MNGKDEAIPEPPAPERTVLASPEALAAALAGVPASAPPVSQPPAAPVFAPGAPEALVGVQLNDLFEITRFIAQGGMGSVYEGRNIASGERVAIKVILPQYAADAQFMALFRREAGALERIGHDALVKYRALAFDRARGINYLAIEYVDGPPLSEALTGEPAEPAQVRRLLRRLALGLAAAHEAGVIHRDLSPDNVLLPGGLLDRAKIIDFGIAKDTNPGEKSVVGEAFAGKFGYAAPEVFGKYGRRIGPWTDIYSLALVVAAVARGAPVDMGVTIVDALEARDKVPSLDGVAAELLPVLSRMLAPDPAERFQTMEEVADAADPRGGASHMNNPAFASAATAAAEAPAFVRIEPIAPPMPAPARAKNRLPLLAGGAALLAFAGVGGWLALGSDGPPAEDGSLAAAPPVVAAAPWPAARPAVAAALAAMPCADVRVVGTPADGVVRLAGWRASTSPVPDSAGGWRLEERDVLTVTAPAAETCRLIDALRAAVPSAPDRRFAIAADQRLPLAIAPRAADGAITVDLQVQGRPPGRALLANIDDGARSAAQRVVSGDAEDNNVDFAAITFDPKPGRYLMALVSSPGRLPAITAAGPPAALRQACANGGCTLASGWIEITP